MSESDLVKRARELLVGVTEGPWHCIQSPRSCEFTSSVWATNDHQISHLTEHMEQNVSREHADAAFVAASRTLVPALLEALEAAEAERARLRNDEGYRRARDACASACAEVTRLRKAAEERDRDVRESLIRHVADLVRIPASPVEYNESELVKRERVVDIAMRIKAQADKLLPALKGPDNADG